jgi:hypothetical protein
MALLPHILASHQKIEPKRREKAERKKKMMSRHFMRQGQTAESAWQRGTLSGRWYFFIRQMTQVTGL